jgi:hypothetical protein
MSGPTAHAARQRRYRERQKAASTDFGLVRVFLNGVLADANRAIASGDPVAPWLLARAATATEVLADLQESQPEDRNAMVVHLVVIARLGRLSFTPEEREAALTAHAEDFRARVQDARRATGRPVRPTSPESLTMAASTLAWANAERLAERSTAASLTQGLNAARRLVRRAEVPGSSEDWATFSAPYQALAISEVIVGGGNRPYVGTGSR